jgi:hypothetical protein
MSDSKMNVTNKVKQAFSAGLGPKARAASWVVAIAGAVRAVRREQTSQFGIRIHFSSIVPPSSTQGLWLYMENKDNGKLFSKQEASEWNKNKKSDNEK